MLWLASGVRLLYVILLVSCVSKHFHGCGGKQIAMSVQVMADLTFDRSHKRALGRYFGKT